MSDLAEVIYSPNDVVWVKLGPVWWPGRVCGEDEIPPEIMKDLRKTPIAIVKFFQEDSFEYVKSLSNIYHYHCPRKHEFIKKGLDMLRSKNRGAPSNMKLFPEDIVRAECLTNGNAAILQNDMFLPEEKPAYSDLFASTKKTSKKLKFDVKKKLTPVKPNVPRLITHPRFLQLSSGQSTDYEARERLQIPVRAECDVEDNSPPTVYSCTECDYSTTRLNVLVLHNKSHTRNYVSPQRSAKATKRKSTVYMKLKERPSGGSSSVEPAEVEAVSAPKIPKTNGTLKVTRTPKTLGRKKGSTTAQKTPTQSTLHTKDANSASTALTPAHGGRRGSAHKGDEIHKSLLEDWLEDDAEPEGPASDENSFGQSMSLADSSATSTDSKSKSCFDFDDAEDHLVIDKSKFKPGRKIPRLVNKSPPLTIAADDVVSIQDSTDTMDVESVSSNLAANDQSGVEDCVDGESLTCRQTSQLQEMGVDSEIEIQTEVVQVNEAVIESRPSKKSCQTLKTEEKTNDAAELQDQVDKLLNEISKTPAKLPDIPRSHKKAQLKAYQQQAEAEELAAQKAAAEAEAAQKAAAEAEAAQKAAAEVEAAQKAAAEVEAAQKAAAEVEAAQKAAAEVEAAQKAAAEVEAAQKAAAEVEAAQKAANEVEAAQKAATEVEAARKTAAEKEAMEKAAAEAEAAQKVAVEAEAVHKAAAEAEAACKPAAEVEALQQAVAEATETSAIRTKAAQKVVAKTETVQMVAPEAEVAHITAVKLDVASKTPNQPVAQNVEEQVAYDLHPETLNIDVSTIPLPSPPKCPVTNESVESSISIGASVTVTENESSSDQSSFASPVKVSSEIQVVGNVVSKTSDANDAAVDQKAASSASSSHSPQTPTNVADVAETSCTPVSPETKLLAQVASVCQTTKSPSTTPPLCSGQQVKLLMNKLGESSSQVLPSQTSAELLKTIKMSGGKNFVCNMAQAKKLLSNSQSSSSPTHVILVRTNPTPGGRSFDLANATTLRMMPNILQKSVAAQKAAAAALAKTTGKNIVLDASTFQSLLQTQSPQLCKIQSRIVLSGAASTAQPQAPASVAESSPSGTGGAPATDLNDDCANAVVSSSSAGQTINSGSVQVDETSSVRTPNKNMDILAKALENTDGLQTEMALSESATNSVQDVCSVAQNTEMASKTEFMFENLTLSTAPIMSACETPSRVVAATHLLAEATTDAVESDGKYSS